MPISQTSNLSSEVDTVPLAKLAYFRQRLKNRMHQLVLREFRRLERMGLSRAELARRIHRKPEQITRWLGSPSNWTLDTLSDLMIAMGGEPDMYFAAPGQKALAEPAPAATLAPTSTANYPPATPHLSMLLPAASNSGDRSGLLRGASQPPPRSRPKLYAVRKVA